MPNKSTFGLDDNLVALLCYVNVCLPIGLVMSIATIVTEKNNKLPRFHAFQSLIITVIAVVISIAIWVISMVGIFIDSAIGFPIVSLLVGLISLVFGLGILILVIIAAVKAYQSQLFKIPVVGGFADKFSG